MDASNSNERKCGVVFVLLTTFWTAAAFSERASAVEPISPPATQLAETTNIQPTISEYKGLQERAQARADLPEAFKVVIGHVLPKADTEFSIRENGRTVRTIHAYRLADSARQPHVYVVFPSPQMRVNPTPIKGLPDFVFAAVPPEDGAPYDVWQFAFMVELMSPQLLDSRELKAAIFEQQKERLSGKVDASEHLKLIHFPATHAYVVVSELNDPIFVARTNSLLTTPGETELVAKLTPSQLARVDRAKQSGTLRWQWRYEYLGCEAAEGEARATATGEMIEEAEAVLDAEQRAGRRPVFNRNQRDQVAQKLIGMMRQSVVTNDGRLLQYLNIDAVLPRLFEAWEIQGEDLAALIKAPGQEAALAQYLLPHLKKAREEGGQFQTADEYSATIRNAGANASGGVAIPVLGIGFGGGSSVSQQTIDSIAKSSGVTYGWSQEQGCYMPVKIDGYKYVGLKGERQLDFAKSVFITDGPQAVYVLDSTVDPFKLSYFDQLRDRRVEYLRELLVRHHEADWRTYAEEVNKKWSEGIPVTLSAAFTGAADYQIAVGTPTFRFRIDHPRREDLKVTMAPEVQLLTKTSETGFSSKIMTSDEDGARSERFFARRYRDGFYSLPLITPSFGYDRRNDPAISIIKQPVWIGDFRFEVRDVATPNIRFKRWVPSGVGDFLADADVDYDGNFTFRIYGSKPERLMDPNKPSEAWLQKNPAPDDAATLARDLTSEQVERRIAEIETRLKPSR